MNWLIKSLQKEARRFRTDDNVRFFVQPPKGTGRGVVYTPSFRRGKIKDYDPDARRYKVWDESESKEVLVHPRNLVPNSISPRPAQAPNAIPTNMPQPGSQSPIIPPIM